MTHDFLDRHCKLQSSLDFMDLDFTYIFNFPVLCSPLILNLEIVFHIYEVPGTDDEHFFVRKVHNFNIFLRR